MSAGAKAVRSPGISSGSSALGGSFSYTKTEILSCIESFALLAW